MRPRIETSAWVISLPAAIFDVDDGADFCGRDDDDDDDFDFGLATGAPR
jgi:hypothetical protein